MKLPDRLKIELKVLKTYLDDEAHLDWGDTKLYDWLLDDTVILMKAILAARMEAMKNKI